MKSSEKIVYKNFRIDCHADFGDYHTTFIIEAHDEYGYGIMITSLYHLRKFLRTHFPEVGNYIDSIRKSIGGYGSKENKILEVLEEEGFLLEKYVVSYFNSDPEKVRQSIKHQTESRKNNPNGNKEAAKKLEEMDSLIDKSNTIQIMGGDLMDGVEQAVVSYLVETFSEELLNGDPEDLLKLEDIFSRKIPDLCDPIIELLYQIRERKYDQS